MTVIFGFTSAAHDASLIAADDRETMSGERADKACIVFGRYLVAVMGNAALKMSVATAASFESSEYETSIGTVMRAPESIEVLCERIAETTTLLAARYQRDAESVFNERGDDKPTRDQYYEQPLGAVIIDSLEHRMVVADFGKLLPLRSYAYSLKSYPQEMAYRFNIGQPRPLGVVGPGLLEKPFTWCKDQLELSRDDLRDHGHVGVLGALGACHVVRSGQVHSRTAFASLENFIRSHVSGLD